MFVFSRGHTFTPNTMLNIRLSSLGMTAYRSDNVPIANIPEPPHG